MNLTECNRCGNVYVNDDDDSMSNCPICALRDEFKKFSEAL